MKKIEKDCNDFGHRKLTLKVKSKNYFSFTDFFVEIKPLLTHVRKTPPLRSH